MKQTETQKDKTAFILHSIFQFFISFFSEAEAIYSVFLYSEGGITFSRLNEWIQPN